MIISESHKTEIPLKRKKLEELKIHLKKDYVGLDNIIDGVVNSMMPFYLFPESLNRPVVVCLWGLTGHGKSSLIDKLVEFLKINHSYLKFDMGEYSGGDNSLRNDLAYKGSKLNTPSNILVFDEFQLGRTIDESHKEVDKNKLRPLWELLDSGILYVQNTQKARDLYDLYSKYKRCLNLGVEVDKYGHVTKNKQIFHSIFKDYMFRPIDYYGSKLKKDEEPIVKKGLKKPPLAKNNTDSLTEYYYEDDIIDKGKPFIFKYEFFNLLYSVDPIYFKELDDYRLHKEKFVNKSLKEIIDLLDSFLDNVSILEKRDYSKSLIFCLGNLDEVYAMSHDINPDADADLFYEHSLKITLPQVKQALSTRFRMEQISRLGNTHFIYPSLNKKHYEYLIIKYMDDAKNYLKNNFDVELTFDTGMNEILYKEGVFASQGARPLLSIFNSMVNSYIAKILTDLMLELPDVKKMHWFYEKDFKYIITATSDNDEKTLYYGVDCNLEKLRLSDNSELQSMVAVHESGHALISCIELKIAPISVLSKTADVSEGLCQHNYKNLIQTKDFLLKEIMILLAGIESEKLIFGESMLTTGSSSDLKKATEIAYNIVKTYGMDNNPFMISPITDVEPSMKYVMDETYEKDVVKILKKAQKQVKKCLANNKKYLLILSKYLAVHPKIDENKIKELLLDLNIAWKDPDTYYGFKEKLTSL